MAQRRARLDDFCAHPSTVRHYLARARGKIRRDPLFFIPTDRHESNDFSGVYDERHSNVACLDDDVATIDDVCNSTGVPEAKGECRDESEID